MKFYLLFFYFLSITSTTFSEEVPAGYVQKWNVAPLSEDDYLDIKNKKCRTFPSVLVEAKIEWPHTLGFKIIDESLVNFVAGYNMQEKLQADKVVVWPNYSSSDWYVFMGFKNCFVRWIEIQPDNIQSIINEGRKKLKNRI